MAKKEETVLTADEVVIPKMKKSVEPKKSKSVTQVIYVGPNSVNLGLTRSTVYIDGVPAVVEQMKDTYPLLHLLFVPINRIEAAEKDLATEGSALNAAFNSIRKGSN